MKAASGHSLEMGYFSGSIEGVFGCVGTLDLCVLGERGEGCV